MKKLLIALLCSTAWGQGFTPRASAAYVNPGSGWAPWTSGANFGQLNYQPYAIGLYCQSTANGPWTPCQPGGASGSASITGGTIDGAVIGGTTPAAGTFTTLNAASGTFTGKVSVTSAAATITSPTFTVVDSEPSTTTMLGSALYAPNLAAGNNLYYIIGKVNTGNNAYYMQYNYNSAGGSNNVLIFQSVGQPSQLSLFSSGNSVFGNGGSVAADQGYKLDVVGTFRAQTSTTSPAYLTPNSYVGRSQTGALTQTIVASTSTAMYQIALASNCKTAVTSAAYTATVSYTDTSNTVQTISSGLVPCDTLGTASRYNNLSVANVLTGTAISLSTSTTGSVSYDIAVTATQITSN